MIKCFFIRRKLYDYLDNALSDSDSDKVKLHLASCVSCRSQSERIARIIEVTEKKVIPLVPEAFWKDFKAGLYTKLGTRLVPASEVNPAPRKTPFFCTGSGVKPQVNYWLRPAWALSTILVIVLSVNFYFRYKPLEVINSDAAIVNEAILLEEISPGTIVTNGDTSSFEELNILYQFGGDLEI